MNDLEKYFRQNTGRLIHKWEHYFEIYDRHLARFREREVHVVEFGVSQGGSLHMWKDYFGPRAHVYGVDINPHCAVFEEDRVRVLIGDQEDRAFLRSVAERVPRIDVLIDDGGHTMRQQIHTFQELFPCIEPDGVYVCEDLHTSYWSPWGGGHRRRGTYVEYAKGLIDELHAWFSADPKRFQPSELTRSVHSLHFYNSMLVIEKRPMHEPVALQTGEAQIPDYQPALLKPTWLGHWLARWR